MSALLCGVIGHVDHGKTALVRALTGIDTDRLKEERDRGVSIVLGFALLKMPQGEIDLVDMPGHERFVRAMISGATGMRAVLLAVSATEGIKPQTAEHLDIARLIGVRQGVIALTKCDLVSDAEARRVGALVMARVAEAGIAAPVVLTSTVSGQGMADLETALAGLFGEHAPPPDDGFAYLPIDRVFTRPGFGPVVTGTLRRGPIAVGDELEIMPGGRKARVRGIQIHGRTMDSAEPGRRTAISLRGVEMADLDRGMALATPEMLVPSRWIDVALSVVASARPLASGDRVRLLVGTTDVAARLRLLDRTDLDPGDSAVAQLHCEEPVAVPAREPFVVRFDSPPMTVGGGRILHPASRRRRRMDQHATDDLAALAAGSPSGALLARLEQAGMGGVPLRDLIRLVGMAPDRVGRRLVEIGARPESGERIVGPKTWDALKAAVLDALARHHRDHPIEHGIALAELIAGLATGTDSGIAAAAIRDLASAGRIRSDRGLYRRTEHDPTRHESDAARRLEAAFRAGGLSPPDEADIVGQSLPAREAMAYLVRKGALVRTSDRVQRRTILFHRDAIEAAKAGIALSLAAPDGFLAREAGAALGISRKFSIPLLEHLDAVRFTRRIGDRRVMVAASPWEPADGPSAAVAEPGTGAVRSV